LFQLLNPIALFVASAVIVPVMIHLWNTRKGKILKVGSIALLSESSKKPARSLRVTNWPLLLLRCLLLVLISLLIAKPFWQKNAAAKNGGWILVSGHELADAYQQHHQLIDSLMQKGFELHGLNPQQEKLLLPDTIAYKQSTPDNYNTWSYLKYLDAALPLSYPVYIFSDQLAQNYSGKRPSVQLEIHRINLQNTNRTDTFPAASYINKEGKAIVTRRISTATGNYYEESNTDVSAISDTGSAIHIGIYAGANIADAKYLQAAIEAIAEYTGRNIVINGTAQSGQQQVIFWLQETEPDQAVLSKLVPGGTILRYSNLASSSMKVASPANSGLLPLDESNAGMFYKYASSSEKGGALWTLANGDPLMSVESTNEKKIIYFSSRFNPQWTDLVWKESFARLLIPIILPAFKHSDMDLRRISPEQAQTKPARGKNNGVINDPGFMNRTDLLFAGWIIVFLVFAAERILSYRQTKQKNA